MKTLISMSQITRTYRIGGPKGIKVPALRGIDVSIGEGEFVAIMGPSGSGKSTLMNILGCLDKPDSGTCTLDGIDITNLSSREAAIVRGMKTGFIFQSFNLIPRTSALENVERPLMYWRPVPGEKRKAPTRKEGREKAEWLLETMGLKDRMYHLPNQLSGGQQQRVAIARALVMDPACILADEPTGNLDSGTSIEILGLLQKLNREGKTIIMVTHERNYAGYCGRIITLKDGLIVSDEPVEYPMQAPGKEE